MTNPIKAQSKTDKASEAKADTLPMLEVEGRSIVPIPVSMRWINRFTVLLLVILGGIIFFGSYTRVEQVQGHVEASQGSVRITAGAQGGILLKRHVEEGQSVLAGQPLLTISEDRAMSSGQNLRQQLRQQLDTKLETVEHELRDIDALYATEKDALGSKIAGLGAQIERVSAEIQIQARRVKVAAERMERKRGLVDNGFVSRVALLDDEETMLELEADQEGFRRQLAALQAERKDAQASLLSLEQRRQRERSALSRAASAIKLEAIEASAKGEYLITAPSDGVVGTILGKTGEAVDGKSVLMTLSPSDPSYVINLFLPSTAIGFAQAGSKVKIRYQAYPFEEFGEYDAVIDTVSPAALGRDELGNSSLASDAYFRVTATPAKQQVQRDGRSFALRHGMKLEAIVSVETRRLYEWLLKPLFASQSATPKLAGKAV